MKIQRKKTTEAVDFGSLVEGTAFRSLNSMSGILWMKLELIKADPSTSVIDYYNAVDLADGAVGCFDPDKKVLPVKVVVVVDED